MKYNVEIANSHFGGNTIDELLLQLEKAAGSADYMGQVNIIKTSIQLITPSFPIILEENDNQRVLAHLEYGPHHGKPFHKISYKPSFKIWLHAVVHELMHLEMYTKASQKHRGIIFKSNIENDINFINRFGTAFKRLAPRIGEENIPKLRRMVQDGLITQMLSCPLDLFVEQHIYERYKGLAILQLMSLLNQEKININQHHDSTVSLMPPKIVSVNKILCLTTSLMLKEFYELDFIQLYDASKHEIQMANDFYEEYQAYRETYKDGDEYELYDYYIENLDMEGIINKVNE